jgi:hypothetical protein
MTAEELLKANKEHCDHLRSAIEHEWLRYQMTIAPMIHDLYRSKEHEDMFRRHAVMTDVPNIKDL